MSRAELPNTQTEPSNVATLGTPKCDGPAVNWGAKWSPTVRYYDPGSKPIAEQLAESTPSNAELIRWAARPTNQPPQSWWDDTTDPFEPSDAV